MTNFHHVDFEFQGHFVDIHAFFLHVTVCLAREDQSLKAPHNKSNMAAQERATHLTAPSPEIRKHSTTRNCPHSASQTSSAHTPSFDTPVLLSPAALSLILSRLSSGRRRAACALLVRPFLGLDITLRNLRFSPP